MSADPRLLVAQGCEIFNGNELLVKGCLETEGGVHFYSGYPGSPISSFFDVLASLKKTLTEKGIRAFQANNEALAAAALNGLQMLPMRGVIAMKSVGVHVAADALALGNLAGVNSQGGAVVICGDDPWCDSTQVASDSRYLCQHLRMPVIEPGSPQELKDWINFSFKISQASGCFIGYIATSSHADGGGSVLCHDNHFPQLNATEKVALDSAAIDLDKVLLPPRTWQHEMQMSERYDKALNKARELGVNRIHDAGKSHSSLGFIVTGLAMPYLKNLLADLGLSGKYPILQMGMSYPADAQMASYFGKLCDKMIVIEERRGFLESNLRQTLHERLNADEAAGLTARLFGKRFPGALDGIPDVRGLNYSVLASKIIPLLLEFGGLSAESQKIAQSELARVQVLNKRKLDLADPPMVLRTPAFCPGCPHRDTSSMLLDLRKNLADANYMKRVHNLPPVDLVAHGDTGCYTLLMFEPNKPLMHNYSGMGLGGGTGVGVDSFISNKQIVFMGDGTFFHSGQIAVSNAVKANQDITFIILENGTTAMTGHQDHAAVETDMFGNNHPALDIESIIRGMAATAPIRILKHNPADRDKYASLMENAILAPGVKVVIAAKECGITRQRKVLSAQRKLVREKGFLPVQTHMNITPEVCEMCMECSKQTGCPGLKHVPTDYGDKMDTDVTWCVNDGACEKVKVSGEDFVRAKPCPSFEQITILRSHRRRYLLPRMSLDKLPDPKPVHPSMEGEGNIWRCHMSGVGGMGIGVTSSILVRAGHKEGYRVLFQEKKGMAIRNGGVFSQIVFVKDDARETVSECDAVGSIPYGMADLLLGVDILEAARAVDPRESFKVADVSRTSAVLNLYKQPTIGLLLGNDKFEPEAICRKIFTHCREEGSWAKDLSEICEQRLGSKQFVNIMMLGVAFQLGLIPVSAHSIAWAIKDAIRREHSRNLKAFNIGRKLAMEPKVLPSKPEPRTWDQLLTQKGKIVRRTRLFGPKLAAVLERQIQTAMRLMHNLSENQKYDLALRIYDIMQYQDERLAQKYIHLVRAVYRRDSAQKGYLATEKFIWNLAKVMLVKDEVYVSYLLTRFEKKHRDILKYGVDIANGDRIVYRHHTKPEFKLFNWRVRINLTTTDWMLQLVSRLKFLRKIPGWHGEEKRFGEWYMKLPSRLDLATDESYALAARILDCPADVTGYREIRYPKMRQAVKWVEAELSKMPAVNAEVAAEMAAR